jgi:hypothetical protein
MKTYDGVVPTRTKYTEDPMVCAQASQNRNVTAEGSCYEGGSTAKRDAALPWLSMREADAECKRFTIFCAYFQCT